MTSLWEGFCKSRRCSRDTYPESYITEYILIYEDNYYTNVNGMSRCVPSIIAKWYSSQTLAPIGFLC